MTLKRTSNLKKGVRMWAIGSPSWDKPMIVDTRESARKWSRSFADTTVYPVIVKLAPRKK